MTLKKIMKRTRKTGPKIGFLKVDRRRARGLPHDLPGIRAWIKQMGGTRPGPKELARLRRLGLVGMPKE